MARETFYDEIEIEDFTWDPKANVYHYPCPCGDRFEITKGQLRDGDEVARCPSCSLLIKVVYEWDDFEDYDSSDELSAPSSPISPSSPSALPTSTPAPIAAISALSLAPSATAPATSDSKKPSGSGTLDRGRVEIGYDEDPKGTTRKDKDGDGREGDERGEDGNALREVEGKGGTGLE